MSFVLTYRDGNDFYFLPTDPPARRWRGPFPSELTLQRAMLGELGEDVVETRTTARPGFLKKEQRR